ncbi:oxygenase MpaB family protein [Amnibacterium sp. CER49]|uniref:oxygenase MpaB family protein n=1 Tax=Amnibacterium sp. CER49 TaxID=3039161 RepID=UPI002448DAF1|nr:oxygenase MpaB family protein [Amnibacterium sp. CER49]MDH2442678.1 oxygenase MpaB family protein [Amnibacterium sp. CER49]
MGPLEILRSRILEVLSGQSGGVPEWTQELARGDDAGYFEPDGPVWTVHRDVATLVAGPRALLLQALHPGAMAGVHDHSRYREDPFGRLNGTIRWITTVSFGSTEQARRATGFVQRIHEHVRGTYPDTAGRPVAYAAADPDLLSWVHLAFTDSFLRTHLRFSARPIPGGPDAYVREWAIAGELMGVVDPPRSVAELDAQLDAVRATGVLRVDERVQDAVHFIRHPPLPRLLLPVYPLLFGGAVAALAPWMQQLLGLTPPGPIGQAGTRTILAGTAALLGPAAAVGAARTRLAALASPSETSRSTAEY